jgi:hypothetical protein
MGAVPRNGLQEREESRKSTSQFMEKSGEKEIPPSAMTIICGVRSTAFSYTHPI